MPSLSVKISPVGDGSADSACSGEGFLAKRLRSASSARTSGGKTFECDVAAQASRPEPVDTPIPPPGVAEIW